MSNPAASFFPSPTAKVDFSKEIDSTNVKDQSVLITGGASGIGESFAEALAELGAYVTIFDLQQERGQAVVKRLSERGFRIQFVQGDVRSWDDQVKAFNAAISFSPFFSLDMVMIVAGIGGQSTTEWLTNSMSPEGKLTRPDTKTIDINLTASWDTTHLALHYFCRSLKEEKKSAKSKQIVFVSSMAGYASSGHVTDYSASKWGLRGIWRTIRDARNILGDDAKGKFRTSLLAPSFVKTGLTEPILEMFEKRGVRWADTDDCVDAMLRIVCDEEVSGRAIAIVPDKKSFDLCDDFEGYDAGREWPQKMVDGSFGAPIEVLRTFYTT